MSPGYKQHYLACATAWCGGLTFGVNTPPLYFFVLFVLHTFLFRNVFSYEWCFILTNQILYLQSTFIICMNLTPQLGLCHKICSLFFNLSHEHTLISMF